MSGLAVAYWQKVFDENLPEVEKILNDKLDKINNLQNIPMDKLSNWQFQQLKDLEKETKIFLGFININQKVQRSYLVETTSIAAYHLDLWEENQTLKQTIEQQDKIIEVLLSKYSKTLKEIA